MKKQVGWVSGLSLGALRDLRKQALRDRVTQRKSNKNTMMLGFI